MLSSTFKLGKNAIFLKLLFSCLVFWKVYRQLQELNVQITHNHKYCLLHVYVHVYMFDNSTVSEHPTCSLSES